MSSAVAGGFFCSGLQRRLHRFRGAGEDSLARQTFFSQGVSVCEPLHLLTIGGGGFSPHFPAGSDVCPHLSGAGSFAGLHLFVGGGGVGLPHLGVGSLKHLLQLPLVSGSLTWLHLFVGG